MLHIRLFLWATFIGIVFQMHFSSFLCASFVKDYLSQKKFLHSRKLSQKKLLHSLKYDHAHETFGLFHEHDYSNVSSDEYIKLKLLLESSSFVLDMAYNDTDKSLLHYAAQKGLTEVCKMLLKARVGIDFTDENGKTPFRYAAQEGHLDICKLLIEKKACPKFVSRELFYAIERGQLEVCKLLLENGAQSNPPSCVGKTTPLHMAVEKGHGYVCQLLVEKGASTKAQDREGDTPLHLFLRDNFGGFTLLESAEPFSHFSPELIEKTIKILLHQNFSILDIVNKRNATPVDYAAKRYDAGVKILIVAAMQSLGSQYFIVPDDRKLTYEDLLKVTCCLGTKHGYQYYVKKHPIVKRKFWEQLIYLALVHGHAQFAKSIWQKYVGMFGNSNPIDDSNMRRSQELQMSPLDHCFISNFKVFDQDDSSEKYDENDSMLHKLCRFGYPGFVKKFLKSGMYHNDKNLKGETPLNCARSSGNREIDDMLTLINVKARFNASENSPSVKDTSSDKKTIEKNNRSAEAAQNNTSKVHSASLQNKPSEAAKKNPSETTSLDVATDYEYLSKTHLLKVTSIFELFERNIDESDLANWMQISDMSLMQKACAFGNTMLVKLILNDEPETLYISDSTHANLLHYAVYSQNEKVCRLLQEKAAENNQYDDLMNGKAQDLGSPIDYVCSQKNISLCRFLFSFSLSKQQVESDVKQGSETLPGAFHNACGLGNLNAVKMLFHDSPDCLNTTNAAGETPLHVACAQGHYDIITFLVKQGASLNTVTQAGQTPLDTASKNKHFKLCKLLIEQGAELFTPDTNNYFAKLFSQDDVKDIEAHLITIRCNDGSTLLHKVCAQPEGKKEICAFLMQYESLLNQEDTQGRTPLMILCREGSSDDALGCVKLFLTSEELTKGIKDTGEIGGTAIHWAVVGKNHTVVEQLLQNGFHAGERSTDGSTVLHRAVFQRDKHLVKLCLKSLKGDESSLNAFDANGLSALHRACLLGLSDIVKLFLVRAHPHDAVNINIRSYNGKTPLHYAVEEGHAEIVTLLLRYGVEPNCKDSIGQGGTPLWYAAYKKQVEICHLLKDKLRVAEFNAQKRACGALVRGVAELEALFNVYEVVPVSAVSHTTVTSLSKMLPPRPETYLAIQVDMEPEGTITTLQLHTIDSEKDYNEPGSTTDFPTQDSADSFL